MVITREISFFILKEEDYKPVNSNERRRVARQLLRLLFRLANRFDGSVKITIHLTLKGNA